MVVIGAGISGLSAAWRAVERGFTVDVLESARDVGGLAGTLREGRCCLDFGPHSFFSHEQQVVDAVRRLFNETLKPIPRKVKFYYRGTYLDYPLTAQGVLCQMGPRASVLSACSYLKGRLVPHARVLVEGEDETVEDWAISSFGEYLYRTFFKPYTEQFWKVPCSELSSRSIPTHTRMSFANTLRLILHRKVTKRGESLIEREMCPTYYPDTGFVEIAEKVAQEVTRLGGRILTGREVIGLTGLRNGRTRVVYRCEGGQEEIEADHVISTIPLPLLVKMIEPAVPLEVLVSADALEYRPLVVLGMLTQKQNILGCGYLYLLDRPYNRIFEMNEFSVQASPRGSNILAVEIPCLRDGEMWRAPKEEIFSMCIASLSEDGFIGPGDVQKLFLVKAAYAYPIYRKGYAVHLERVLEHLKTYHSLSTVGRCGEFMYMDIDECMKRAFEHVDKIADSRYSPVVPA